jgi:phage replication O-like protein O
MANPQIEDGHTDIANSLMEALARTRIPGEARQVLDYIFRCTYGWHEKERAISLAEFSEGTGLSKAHICRGIRGLLSRNIIAKTGNVARIGNDVFITYGIQKDFDKWQPVAKTGNVARIGNKGVPELATHQRKKELKKYIPAFSKSRDFFETFWKTYPSRNGRKVGKKAAYEHFCKVPEGEIEDLLKAVENYASECKPGFAKDAERFLKKDFWKDWVKKESGEEDLDPMEIEYRRKYGKPMAEGL